MRFLLDSNAFLWSAFEPAQLSPVAREAIEDSANDLVVSVVTPIELGIAVAKGKLALGVPLREFYVQRLRELGVAQELPVTREHALESGLLRYSLKDPMDRILAAQSRLEGLPLISSDRRIAELGVEVIW